MKLDDYVTLGRSGLRVSPLCLGTMTFGNEWGWGSDEATSRAIFDRYLERGGNFVDGADMYQNGHCEEMLGRFVKDRGVRDRVVIATKFGFCAEKGNPNAGGAGRKNAMRAVEGSLRRLGTDYVDLYWLHAWDVVTPVEEVAATLDDLVRQGKVRHVGLSDVPAWFLTRAQTIAELRGTERIAAMQFEYSLVERNIEREHVPAAREMGIALCPWSPLAGGFLAGKYRRTAAGVEGAGRLDTVKDSGNPSMEKFSERNWKVLDVLLDVSEKLHRPPAQVALNWLAHRPGVTSTIVGATKLEQLDANLAAIEFEIPRELDERLEAVGRPDVVHPYLFFGDTMQAMVRGGTNVRAWKS